MVWHCQRRSGSWRCLLPPRWHNLYCQSSCDKSSFAGLTNPRFAGYCSLSHLFQRAPHYPHPPQTRTNTGSAHSHKTVHCCKPGARCAQPGSSCRRRQGRPGETWVPCPGRQLDEPHSRRQRKSFSSAEPRQRPILRDGSSFLPQPLPPSRTIAPFSCPLSSQ